MRSYVANPKRFRIGMFEDVGEESIAA